MPHIDPDKVELILEALEELMYKVSLQLEDLKGGPMTRERRDLTAKQRELETLQHDLLMQIADKK